MTGLVVFGSWSGAVVLVASLVSAVSAVVALVTSRRNAKAIREMTTLRKKFER
jgi:HAMP domain-containing protein